jgi:hypothetical protein
MTMMIGIEDMVGSAGDSLGVSNARDVNDSAPRIHGRQSESSHEQPNPLEGSDARKGLMLELAGQVEGLGPEEGVDRNIQGASSMIKALLDLPSTI